MSTLGGMANLMYHHHPFFSRTMKELGLRPHDIQREEDLKKLPVINKLDWIKDFRSFILQPNEQTVAKTLRFDQKLLGLSNREELKRRITYEFQPITFFSTSGRTSLPVPSFLTAYDFDLLQRTSSQFISKVIQKLDKKVAQNLFPHAPHLAYWQVFLTCRGIPDLFYFSLGVERTEYQVKLMEKFGRQVRSVLPDYSLDLRIYVESFKPFHIFQRAKNHPLQLPFEIDFSFRRCRNRNSRFIAQRPCHGRHRAALHAGHPHVGPRG